MSLFLETGGCRPGSSGNGMSGLNGPTGAGPGDPELKTQFMTREGTYRLMTLAEYSRPNRVGYANNAGAGAPVRVSFVNVPNDEDERIAFNFGREIFVYPYKGLRKAADLTKPIDKRVYKGTFPTCHDFGVNTINTEAVTCNHVQNSEASVTSPSSAAGSGESSLIPLLVGFSGGQIQLIDPVRKELSKLFNEERHIEKTRVTCIKWIPNALGNYFMVSYSSGNLYVYNHELACTPQPPVYQMFKQGQGYAVYTCKTKTTRNPLYKWCVGKGSINEFAFSPCGHFLAIVSQDGHLRVFNYDAMELIGTARSYFGGLLCVCWSPDGKYIAVGGEDDLVTLYSMAEKRVVIRGQGHKSWVSVVAFDQYNMSYGELPDGLDFSGSDEEAEDHVEATRRRKSVREADDSCNVTCYRFGSVGQDTFICLWDITEDMLRLSDKSPTTSQTPSNAINPFEPESKSVKMSNSNSVTSRDSGIVDGHDKGSTSSTSSSMSLTHRLASLNFGDRHRGDKESSSGRYKANFSLRSDKSNSSSTSLTGAGSGSPALTNKNSHSTGEHVKLGTAQCPRIHDVPVIEPLVIKKIAHERLTSLVFREECLVTACQDGYVCTWARPGRANGSASSNCPTANQSGGSGTVV